MEGNLRTSCNIYDRINITVVAALYQGMFKDPNECSVSGHLQQLIRLIKYILYKNIVVNELLLSYTKY